MDFIDSIFVHCYASATPELVSMAIEALASRTPTPVTVFISYSHKDNNLKNELVNHLTILKREGVIAEWHDQQILPGDTWSKDIDTHLESAQIILLLISSDFLASDYCYDKEMKRALERHESGEARVIPIFLRPCVWTGAPFRHLQGLPADGEPVTSSRWSSTDEAFKFVTQGIRTVAEIISRTRVIGSPEQTPDNRTAEGALLHQLPPPPADFTGRTDELVELMQEAQKRKRKIIGIFGMGGRGKTALALQLGEKLKADYPDGQFYLDLKGVSDKPLSPNEAMGYIIRGYHPTAERPTNQTELSALYRSVLHQKKALLLMDNAKNVEQVEPLVPPPECLLLITSRQHFAIAGLLEKDLDVLPIEDARELLFQIASRLSKENMEIGDQLVQLCGYLPLALRNVGSALSVRKDLSGEDYLKKLLDTQQRLRLTAVDSSLELSYHLLSAELQKRFCNLAVFPDTFDIAAAAAIWEVNPDVAEDCLGQLLLYSLLDFNEVTRRYRFHDLVRLFARNRQTVKEREAAQRQHAAYYLQILKASDDLYARGKDSVLQGLALFDVEWSNIQAGQAWALAHANEDIRIAEYCYKYPAYGFHCLSLRQNPREHIKWLEPALAVAQRLRRDVWEAALLGDLGLAHFHLGEYREAIEYHQRHLQIARKIGDHHAESTALGHLGMSYRGVQDVHQAVECLEAALKIARESERLDDEANALGNLGAIHLHLKDYRFAIQYLEESLPMQKEIGDRRKIGYVLGNLGSAYVGLGDYRRALEYHEEHLSIARKIGDRMGEGGALWNKAQILALLGDQKSAIDQGEAALSIFKGLEDPDTPTIRHRIAEWRKKEDGDESTQ